MEHPLPGVEVRYENVHIRQGPGLQKWATWRDKKNHQKLSMNVAGVDHLTGKRTFLRCGGELSPAEGSGIRIEIELVSYSMPRR